MKTAFRGSHSGSSAPWLTCLLFTFACLQAGASAITWDSPTNDLVLFNHPTAVGARWDDGSVATVEVESGPGSIRDGILTVTNLGIVTLKAIGQVDGRPLSRRRSLNFSPLETTLTGAGGIAGALKTVNQIARAGDMVYLAGADGISIIDTSTPRAPKQVGFHATFRPVSGIEVVQKHLLISQESASVVVVDVSDPANPSAIASIDTPAPATGLAVSGTFAAVAVGSSGVMLLDISNIRTPRRIDLYATGDVDQLVGFEDGLLVITTRTGLLKVAEVTNGQLSLKGQVAIGGAATGLAIEGDLAYVACGLSGIRAVDLSNPATPRLAGVIEGVFSTVKAVGAQVFSLGQDNIARIWDARSLNSGPKLLATFNPYGRSTALLPEGDSVLFAGADYGVVGFRLKGRKLPHHAEGHFPSTMVITNSPAIISFTSDSGVEPVLQTDGLTAVLEGNRIKPLRTGDIHFSAVFPENEQFAAETFYGGIDVTRADQSFDWQGVEPLFLGLNTPRKITVESSSGLPVTITVASDSATFSNSTLLILEPGSIGLKAVQEGNEIFTPKTEWKIFNQSAPAQKQLSSSTWSTDPGLVSALALYKSNIFTATVGGLGVNTIGLTNGLMNRGLAWEGSRLTALGIVGETLLAGAGERGLALFDLKDAPQVRLAGRLPLPGYVEGLDADTNLVCVAAGNDGLQILKWQPGGGLLWVGSLDTEGYAFGVVIDGGFAYVADGPGGVLKVDIGDPANPLPAGRWNVDGAALDIATTPAGIFVAAGAGGLKGFKRDGSPLAVERPPIEVQGRMTSVIVNEKLLYALADGQGVFVYSLGEPDRATYFYILRYPLVEGMAFEGTRGVIVDGKSGLDLLAIPPGGAFQRLSNAPLVTPVLDVDVSDGLACMASASAGILVADVSNPATPALLSRIPSTEPVSRVSMDGRRMYALTRGNRVMAINLQNPKKPVIVDSKAYDIQSIKLAAVKDGVVISVGSQLFSHRLTQAGNLAPASGISAGGSVGQLQAAGDLVFAQTIGGVLLCYRRQADGGLKLLSRSNSVLVSDFQLSGSKVWTRGNQGDLNLFDYSDPEHPKLVATSARFGFGPLTAAAGSIVVGGNTGGAVWDAADPNNVRFLFYLGGGASSIQTVKIKNGLAYLAEGEKGLEVLELKARKVTQNIPQELPGKTTVAETRLAPPLFSSVGLPVSNRIVSGPATVTEGHLAFLATGVVTIQSTQMGDEAFEPATLTQTIVVTSFDPQTAVQSWLAADHPSVPANLRGPNDDPDGDGASNLLEWFFGTSPVEASARHGRLGAESVRLDPATGVRTLRFSISTSFPPDYGWHVEERPSLEPQHPWTRVEPARILNNFGAITVNLGSGQSATFYRIVVGAP